VLQKTYEQGAVDALKHFGLEKTAVGMLPMAMAKGRQFLRGQAGSLGQLGQGLQGMLGPTANPAARGQAWQGLKGIAPSLGIAGAGYLMSRGGDEPQQPQRY
jgi:hypothetical protein